MSDQLQKMQYEVSQLNEMLGAPTPDNKEWNVALYDRLEKLYEAAIDYSQLTKEFKIEIKKVD